MAGPAIGKRNSEWIFPPKSVWGFPHQALFIEATRASLTYTMTGGAGPQILVYTFNPDIKVAMPIRLNVYYTIPLISKINILFGGGIGFYSGKISRFSKTDITFPLGGTGWSSISMDAEKKFSIGFQGSALLEYTIIKNVALVMEFQGRLVKIRGLKGIRKTDTDYGDHDEEKGILYYYTREDLHFGGRVADLQIWEKIPDASIYFINDIRKAILDYSGVSLKIGIRIRLF